MTIKRGHTKPLFKIGGIVIELQDNIRYNDVELSSELRFRKYIETVNNKAEKNSLSISSVDVECRKTNGRERKLLTSFVHSQLLYISPIWAEDLTL